MQDYDDFGPSKTSLKKEADKAQAIGTQLLGFNDTFLSNLNLDETLFDAIILAKTIRKHGGKRRQMQLVGKLMRRADIDAIEQAINEAHAAGVNDREQHHRAERLRDKLIAADANTRLATLAMITTDNTAALRLLKDTDHYEQGSPGYKKSSRNLFRLLLELPLGG